NVSQLRPHEPNDESMFPRRDARIFYDFGEDPDNEYFVDDVLAHKWRGTSVYFLVQWTSGEPTWLPYSEVKDLEALSHYYELLGIKHWRSLPR
ncbi:uncharacterized protein BXZ73DRAFT_19495, partial [Epithele typhae]|uniref:uncharacterized protein n=1 Tax=Epithele typhae TaxID=378194 RepID=UPI002007D43B